MTKLQRDIFTQYARQSEHLPGLTIDDFKTLRRAAITLHRWYEHECNGVIQRDENTNIPYWYVNYKQSSRAADREKGAIKTIDKICKQSNLHYYIQTGPRGGTLYVDKQPISDNTYNRATFIA